VFVFVCVFLLLSICRETSTDEDDGSLADGEADFNSESEDEGSEEDEDSHHVVTSSGTSSQDEGAGEEQDQGDQQNWSGPSSSSAVSDSSNEEPSFDSSNPPSSSAGGSAGDSSDSSSSSSSSNSSNSSNNSSGNESDSSLGDDSDVEFIPMQNHALPVNANQELYPGALTLMQSFLMIHQHFDRYRPSREEKISILKLLSHHLPAGNFFATLYEYENFLDNGEMHSTIHEYCGRCYFLFQAEEETCPVCHALRWEGGKIHTLSK
jgi:hypothetical protein